MRRSPSVIATILGLSVLVGSLALAAPADGQRPHRYLPGGLDSGLVTASAPDTGRTWAAWSYRNGAEFDIALSVVEAEGPWSEPIFLGLHDGADQSRPALVVDPLGRFHVVFEDTRGRILLSSLPVGASEWSAPVAISEPQVTATEPAARVIGDRLVIAYRAAGTIRLLDLTIEGETVGTRGLNDGPDPVENKRTDDGSDRRKKKSSDRGVTLHPITVNTPTELTLLPLLGDGRKVPDTP